SPDGQADHSARLPANRSASAVRRYGGTRRGLSFSFPLPYRDLMAKSDRFLPRGFENCETDLESGARPFAIVLRWSIVDHRFVQLIDDFRAWDLRRRESVQPLAVMPVNHHARG